MLRNGLTEDPFARSRMSFEDHLGELSTRMRRAIAGVVVVALFVFAADFFGMALKLPWLGIGFPALRFLAVPAEREVRSYYRNRYDQATERWLASRAAGAPEARQSFALGIRRSGEERIEVAADVDPVELARLVKVGEIAADFQRPLKAMSVQEAMLIYFKVAMAISAILASPWVFFQMWAFVAAGLYTHERRSVRHVLPASVVLFLAGVGLCQFAVLPATVRGMLEFNEWSGFDPELRVREWLGLAILLPLIFGCSFQVPLAMAFSTRLGIATSADYLRYWRHAAFGMALFATVATPTQDAITWAYLFVPLVSLYFMGVGVCRILERQPRESAATSDGRF